MKCGSTERLETIVVGSPLDYLSLNKTMFDFDQTDELNASLTLELSFKFMIIHVP